MIIHFSFEELQAVQAGARVVLKRGPLQRGAVAAPPRELVHVESLAARLEGDITLGTLADQQRVESALRTIAETLAARMNHEIVRSHPASEPAVAAYFEYAHTLSVLARVEELGDHMRALIEVVTGSPADAEVARSFEFAD